jgi:hypothetical protein
MGAARLSAMGCANRRILLGEIDSREAPAACPLAFMRLAAGWGRGVLQLGCAPAHPIPALRLLCFPWENLK